MTDAGMELITLAKKTGRWTALEEVQESINPCLIILSARSRFAVLQLLFGLRLEKYKKKLSLSLLFGFESIQPKQRASSTASSYVTDGFPLSL
jgi:hypothetical protein